MASSPRMILARLRVSSLRQFNDLASRHRHAGNTREDVHHPPLEEQ